MKLPYYFCIAQGNADCTPDSQDYYVCTTKREMVRIINAAKREFIREEVDGQDNAAPCTYSFRAPGTSYDTNWTQRLCIARGTDYVLDVIGMSCSEYLAQQDSEYERSFGDD